MPFLRDLTQRVGSVDGRRLGRRLLERFEALVELAAVVLEVHDALAAAFLAEAGDRQDLGAHGLDAVEDGRHALDDNDVPDAQAFHEVPARLALGHALLADLDVVRQVVAAVGEAVLALHLVHELHPVGEALGAALLEAQPPVLSQSAHPLVPPDGHVVVLAEIPGRVDRDRQVERQARHDAALPAKLEHDLAVVRALDRALERLLRRRWVLAVHQVALGFVLLRVPGLLARGEANALASLDVGEVGLQLIADDDVSRVEDVLLVLPPGVEEEPEIERRERRFGLAALASGLGVLEEIALAALGRALDDDDLTGVNRVQRARADLLRLVGELGANFPVLADVQELHRATAHRGATGNRRAIRELELLRAFLARAVNRRQVRVLLEQRADDPADLVGEQALTVVQRVREQVSVVVRSPGAEVDRQDRQERRVVRDEALGNVGARGRLQVDHRPLTQRLDALDGRPSDIAVTLAGQLSAFPPTPMYEPGGAALAENAENLVRPAKREAMHGFAAELAVPPFPRVYFLAEAIATL